MHARQGDLINWLDRMVRYLEAIEAVARVLGKAGERKRLVEGGVRIQQIIYSSAIVLVFPDLC
jgi:superfamily II helicase